MNFTIELQGEAPSWIDEATHYFENEYGEQWIAKIDEDEVVISGLDIEWEEINISYENAKEYLEIQKEGMLAVSKKECNDVLNKLETAKENGNPLFKYIFNKEEKFWLFSILTPFQKSVELNKKYSA